MSNELLAIIIAVCIFIPTVLFYHFIIVDNYLDKFLSGVYMVTAIKHTFNRTIAKDNKITYTMKIEITKDALEDIVINKTREEV